MDELEQALAWFRSAPKSWLDGVGDKLEATGQWIWEVVQGDFHEGHSVGQIATGTLISMIPFVDQICDVRDLVANCRNISKDSNNTGYWVALALTLVGLFPVLGSFAKGACKVMFLYLRKAGFDVAGKMINKKAYDAAINGLNKLLEQPAVRKTLKVLRIYEPYPYLARKIRELKAKISLNELLKAYDKLADVARAILQRAADWGPASIKQPVKNTIQLITDVRKKANDGLKKALQPLLDALDGLAKRLEIEGELSRRASIGRINPHSVKPATMAQEEFLLRKNKPGWVDANVDPKYPALEIMKGQHKEAVKKGWPDVSDDGAWRPTRSAFNTFDKSMKAVELSPGTKLYRVVSPKSTDNSICWMREEEFLKLKSKSDWRRHFAVWKNWNDNGEFIVYVVPPGKPLKVWEGRAATQKMDKTEFSLEGGYNQIVLDPATLDKRFSSQRKPTGWGYTDRDIAEDLDAYVGIPKLQNNWRQ
ncbi:hypothetical protein ACUXVY_19720 [Chromobacterium haemolyticum]|uniref:hypothetical protein n=1 Tax=Chromobacterium haemolyticum TaxID=394935 RepID=UPI004056629A